MSRTFRRLKGHVRTEHYTSFIWLDGSDGYERFGPTYYDQWKGCSREQLFYKKFHRHHRDTHSGIYSVPSWFNNLMFQRSFRMRQRQAIHRFVRGIDEDVVSNRKPVRSGWYWW